MSDVSIKKCPCETYAEMAELLRSCQKQGIEAWWNHDELYAGELIVYVRERHEETKGERE